MQVYVQSRMLIPVPSDVERHSSFHRVFGESAGLCSVIENKVNRRWLKLDQGSYAYDVLVWNKLNAGALGRVISRPVCCLLRGLRARLTVRAVLCCGSAGLQDTSVRRVLWLMFQTAIASWPAAW